MRILPLSVQFLYIAFVKRITWTINVLNFFKVEYSFTFHREFILIERATLQYSITHSNINTFFHGFSTLKLRIANLSRGFIGKNFSKSVTLSGCHLNKLKINFASKSLDYVHLFGCLFIRIANTARNWTAPKCAQLPNKALTHIVCVCARFFLSVPLSSCLIRFSLWYASIGTFNVKHRFDKLFIGCKWNKKSASSSSHSTNIDGKFQSGSQVWRESLSLSPSDCIFLIQLSCSKLIHKVNL